MRLVVGLTLAAHGFQKLFGWFGGRGPEGTGRSFEAMGFLPGRLFALVAGACEAAGGLFLAAGFLVPLAAATVAGTMLSAALSVHLKNGFFLSKNGWEYTFVIAGVAVGLAFTGPGVYSLDHAVGWTLSGPAWGAGAIAVALVAGLTTDAYRRHALAEAS